MYRLTYLFLLLFSPFILKGQEDPMVHYHLDKVLIKFKPSRDSLRVAKNREAAMSEFQMNGYVGIIPTDTLIKKKQVHYYFQADHLFKRVKLINSDREKESYVNRDIYGLINTLNDQLIELENSGFPFAQLKITKHEEIDEQLVLTYKIDSGQFFIIDKIHLKGRTDFHEKTVLGMLGLKTGEPYDEDKIKNIPEIFKNTKSYSSPKAPEILFREGKAELYIYLEKKKSSNADGYVGFQQDQISEKLTLNGYVNLELKNALNRAETIHLNWKNNPDQTQNLKMIFEYPYLFGTPFGIGANADLQKQDTTFVRSNIMFELLYTNPQFRVGIYDQIENSSTISSTPISGFRDYSKNTIGANFFYQPFMPDYLSFYHPSIALSGGVFNYRTDTLDNEAERIANRKYSLKYLHTLDFLKYFHLNNSIHYQGVNSSIGLARNELIYFGGLQTVRGFYELELEGQEIWIVQNEFEFRPVELISLKLIYDYTNFLNDQKHYAHAVGFGFGLINNNSQLDIIVANGILDDNPFNVSNTKIHIGFKSNF